MNALWTIAKRELRTYFNSPVAYIVVTVFTLIAGFMFFTELFIEKQADMRAFFNLAPFLFMFFGPAITMRLLAEERGTGTIELLITMPVRDWEVVAGKFLAALLMLATLVGLTLLYAITVAKLGPLDKGPAFGGYFGLLLLGGAYVAIGVMASALTRNQIIAFIVSFAIGFALFLLGKLTQFLPEAIRPLIAFLAIDGHFENIQRGVIDSRDVLYYLSVMGVCLILATNALDARRWR